MRRWRIRWSGIAERWGVHDHALAESAVAAPRSGFAGHYLHGELFELASAYLFHLVQNHPFLDGKKRVGTATALTFLGLNGVETKIPNQVLVDMMTHPPSPNQGETDNPPSQHSSSNTRNRSHPASPILPPLHLSIGALSIFVKGGTFFIPAALESRRREFALVESLPRCHRHHLRVALAIPRANLDWDWAACFVM